VLNVINLLQKIGLLWGLAMGTKMTKNQFKRATKKFIRKRVYSWRLENGMQKIEVNSFEARIRYYSEFDEIYQIFEKARDLGFVRGFLYAREVGKRNKEFYFSFNKKIID